MPRAKGTVYAWATAALGLVLLTSLGYLQRDRFLPGKNDFLQLYVGAKLSGTPELYEPEANKRVSVEAVGVWLESVYHSRLPFYAFFLRPLGHLPYLQAYWLFQALNLAAFLIFLRLMAPVVDERISAEFLVLTCLCYPLLANFLGGQDLPLVLLAAGAGLHYIRKGRDGLGGLILSLCAIKVHLFVLLPIALVIHRRWAVLRGGLLGGSLLTVVCFLSDGWDWPRRYLGLLSNPELHPGPEHMPTIRGLVFAATGTEVPALLTGLSIAIGLLVAYLSWKNRNLELAVAFSLVGGILVGYHAYLQDCIILLLTLALVLTNSRSVPIRAATAMAVTPPPYLCLLAGRPYNAVVPIVLIAVLGIAAVCREPE